MCGEFGSVEKSGEFALSYGILTSFCLCHLFVTLYSDVDDGVRNVSVVDKVGHIDEVDGKMYR